METSRVIISLWIATVLITVAIVGAVLGAFERGIKVWQEEQREFQAIERIRVVNEVCHGNWEHWPSKRASENSDWFECLQAH